MEHLIRRIRDDLLATADTVCLDRARLLTDAYRRFEGEPAPILRAKAFAHVLGHMQLDVRSNPIFAGNTSAHPRAWMLQPEFGFGEADQVLIENDGLEGLLEGQIPGDLLEYWKGRSFGGHSGMGHLAVDLGRVVHVGLEAIIREAESHAAEGDVEAQTYREAMAIALEAVIGWARRYAAAAQVAASAAADPVVRRAHGRVAEACRHVPARPARNLFEALQAIVLCHLAIHLEGHGMSVSVGLPDRVLAPFIDESLDAEQATQLLMAFMLKLTANSLYGRGSLTQAITVGGVDHQGRDCCNALTLCFLEACDRVRVGDPHVFVRWHDNMSPDVKHRAAELLASGLSMPLLANDTPTAGGFMDAGVAPEDAWEYCVIGCNELGVPGRCADSACAMAGTVQYLELLNAAMAQVTGEGAPTTMSDLLTALERTMAQRCRQMRNWGVEHRRRMAREVPTPLTSALMRGCVQRGQDLLVGMDYHLPGVYERGLTNAANALAAIEELVLRQGSVSLKGIVEAMAADWSDGDLRARVQAAPKWGNDDERADRWARELVAMRGRVLNALDDEGGTGPHMACHVVRSLHHVDGRRLAASADGRKAGQPVCDSIGAQSGTARHGPTAILRSVAKLDAPRYYKGGYNLNLTLPATGASPRDVLTLVEVFFAQGGQELQVNCLDVATLRAAQERPREHRDLLVRVAGFTARFVDLSRREQEELIARAEAAG